MTDIGKTIGSAGALRIAGLDRTQWNSVVSRGLVEELPKAGAGKAGRRFSVDDLMALLFFVELRDIGVALEKAGPLHDELKVRLREHPAAEELYLCIVKGNAGNRSAILDHEPAGGSVLWALRIPAMRAAAEQRLDTFQTAYDAAE